MDINISHDLPSESLWKAIPPNTMSVVLKINRVEKSRERERRHWAVIVSNVNMSKELTHHDVQLNILFKKMNNLKIKCFSRKERTLIENQLI